MELIRNIYFAQGLVATLVIGILGKIIGWFSCFRLYQASMDMDKTRRQRVSTLKKRFESYYQLDAKIHNISYIVDKNIMHHRILGINANVWEQVPEFCGVLCMFLGTLGATGGIVREAPVAMWGKTLLVSGVFGLGLFFVDRLFSIEYMKDMARTNLLHFIENVLPNRMEKEEEKKVEEPEGAAPEPMKQEETKEVKKPQTKTAATKEMHLTKEDLKVLKDFINEL